MTVEQAKSIVATFDKVLGQLIARPETLLIDLDWFSGYDSTKILSWNSNELSKVEKCIDLVIEEQMMLRPDAEAVCSWDGSLSYSELSYLSNKLASHLVELGVGPEIFVPICFDKSKFYIVSCIAILKAGGAFVPLDPQFPTARLQSLTRKVGGRVLLCSPHHTAMLKSVASTIIPVDGPFLSSLPSPPESTVSLSSPGSKAYMIFTSGTTGEPKGAVIEHAALLSSARAHGPAMLMDSSTRALQFAASTFDVSITEIFTTLTLGGCVCVPSEDDRLNNIEKAINALRVNWALLTPTFVKFINPADVPGFKTLVTGGEAMTQAIIRSWSHRNLVNCYGPAETAVVSHVNPFMTEAKNPLCIGRQVGIHCWVVDRYNHDRLMPAGSVGELLIEGYTLSREYYREEEKTSQAFIFDPVWTRSQQADPQRRRRRMYKTGDLVRYNNDGTFYIAGRKDTQIKFHGQRIELGEIEHHINLDRNIKHGMVVLPKSGFCQGRLVTMIQLADHQNQDLVKNGRPFYFLDGDLKDLADEYTTGTRDMLRKRLPPYMVPSMWLVVEFIPRLQSGKLDRKKVARWIEDMDEELYRRLNPVSEAAAGSTEPVNETEKELQAIWAHVLNLNLDQVGLQQPFLNLGGDSISAMQVMGRCRKKGIGLTVHEILRSKSISHLSQLAKTIQAPSHYEEAIDQPFDLSPIQRLYFDRPGHSQGHYNQSFLLRANLNIQENDLRSALEVVIRRHSMLRARFFQNESTGIWQQRVTNEVTSSYRFRNLRIDDRDSLDSKLAESQTCLNELEGPMFAADLIEVGDQEQLLFVVGHHLVIDLVSWRVILQDVEELLLDPNASSEKPLPFQTWCSLQQEHSSSLDPAQALPIADVPSGDATYWGMEHQQHVYGDMTSEGFALEASQTSLLLTKCHEALRTEIPDILIAALIYSFSQTFGDRPAPPIFAEGHGRESWDRSIDISRTIGWFTTIYPVYVSAAHKSETLVNIVRFVKDIRRKIPGKGRPYFASRWLTSEGQEAFGHHWPLEVTFNYLGQYQQLERRDALLTPAAGIAGETRGAGGAADVGSSTPCISFFEISAVIISACLRFSFTFNHRMKHQKEIRMWIANCKEAVWSAVEELSRRSPEHTLSDFPLLSLTYDGLERMKEERLASVGVASLDLVEDVYPCSPMQEGLLVSTAKDNLFYAAYTLHEVKGRRNGLVNANRLSDAWRSVVERHPILRTVFIESVNQETALYDQVVLKHVDAHLFVTSKMTDEEAIGSLSGQQTADYDDGTRPLHRFTICTTSTGKVFCRLEISHIVMDGTSMSILFRDLALAYEGKLSKGPGPLYSDYIKYLVEQPIQPAIDYWKSYLHNVEPCHFPVLTDGEPTLPKELKCIRVKFEKLGELQKHCDELGLTFANAIHAAWALTLRCYTDSDEVCFGYLTSARDAPIDGAQDAVGPYINMLVCRATMTDTFILKDVMGQIQQDYFDSLPYRHIPLAEVQHALRLSNVSLFNTALSYRKLPPNPSEEPLVTFAEVVPTYDPDEYNVSINIEAGEKDMAIDLAYWTDCLSDGQAHNIASTFTQALNNILSHTNHAVGDIEYLSDRNRYDIQLWNETQPEIVDDCVHRIFEQQAAKRPSAPAICGWDASFTYAELDEVSSKLASRLSQLGVGAESFVLICFEKSAYAIVSMLAVLKAGGACVPLDAKFPRGALELRANDTGAQIILAAPQCEETVRGLVPQVILVDEKFLRQLPCVAKGLTANSSPKNACFIIYTSGSTGKPKGVILEHRGITTSARAHGPLLGYTPESRVLQFASYTFDNSLAEMFTTLMWGGCVCVPSEYARLNDLAGAINSLKVNFADITPTVATFLQPSEVPTLKRLALGGEAVTKRVVDIWGEHVSMHACYGPSECSINSAYSGDIAKPGKATNIGRACGCLLWVVHANDHNRLVPVGCIGELLVEGPIVARGYLHDPEKTMKAFIETPAWATGPNAHTRRMYKTGDLVRYDSDGTLMYLGRKDTQVKLNGQRIELGEIEHHVEKNLPGDAQSAVDLVVLGQSQTSKKALAAFICMKSDGAVPDAHDIGEVLVPMSEAFKEGAKALEIALTGAIPAYMVPTAWLPIAQMPLTSSGKLNRKQLRSIAQTIPDERVATYRLAGKSGRQPETEMEKKIASLWEKILLLEHNAVGAEDSFFKLGGDSIGAMRLVTAARAISISLTVANVFQRSKLCEMANAASELSLGSTPATVAPFSLIKSSASVQELKTDVAMICQIDAERIQDIYPCTAIQEGLMALSIKEPGAYVAQMVYRLPSDIDLHRFKAAWGKVIEVEMTLRTRVIYTESLGFLQIVVRDLPQWHSFSDLGSLSEKDRQLPAFNGGDLTRYSIVGEDTSSPHFVWTIHHALYDGWCLPLILDKVKAAYLAPSLQGIASGPSYATFIRYLTQIDKSQTNDFWSTQLADTSSIQFPRLPNPTYQARASAMMSHKTRISRKVGSEITAASAIRAAWALTVATYSGSDDVVFCETVTGRDAPVDGLEDMIGATLTTIPTRIRIDRESTAEELLKMVQAQSAAATAYQYTGLQYIKRLSSDTAVACEAQNLIAINSGSKESGEDAFWAMQNNEMAGTNFYTYPLMISCYSDNREIEIDAHYDEEIISAWQMEKLLQQFAFFISRLTGTEGDSGSLKEIDILNPSDRQTISAWNSEPVASFDGCIHNVVHKQSLILAIDKPAVCAWDASYTYQELDSIAAQLACYLVELGIDSNTAVPLCFEKSAFTVVAMLAVLKAGASFVPLEARHPEARLSDIVKDSNGQIVLCSSRYQGLCNRIANKAISIDIRFLKSLPSASSILPTCSTDSAAYIIFTSGTTGKPKGTIVEHAAFCTSAYAHGSVMQMNQSSRVLQFASHSFDASVMEILTTLICGGCVCIPDEESRLSNITQVINDLQVNWTLLTPSFVQTIRPADVPCLQTLVMGGEAMSQTHISTWCDKVNFMNAYGPSETSVVATVNADVMVKSGPTNIGRAVGSRSWVVNPIDHDYLAPVGSIGELLVEGPILARGYLNNPQKTAEAFIENPRWATQFGQCIGKRMYKTGDLVKYTADGSMVFLGRKDTQVKLHGQRLELGEVEHHLSTDTVIKHALAAIPASGSCRKRLVAVLSLEASSRSKSTSTELELVSSDVVAFYLSGIRERIASLLPPYMIPSKWIILKDLPLQPSGKLDRRRIITFVESMNDHLYRQISDAESSSDTLSRDATHTEMQLRAIWAHVLNLSPEKISFNRSFLQLGGDSISAMQVMARCRSEKLGITVSDIIQSKSLTQLASRVTLPKEVTYHAEEVEKSFALSPIQQMYFECMGNHGSHFNQSVLFGLRFKTSIDRLRQATIAVVNSHSMLRARFTKKEMQAWEQRISGDVAGSYSIRVHNSEAIKQASALIETSQRSLNIENGPILAVDVFEAEGDAQQLLSLTAHHLVVDVVSWRIIVQDIENFLARGSLKPPSSLPFQVWCQLQAEHAQQQVAKFILQTDNVPAADFAYWGMSDRTNLHGDAVATTFELDAQTTVHLTSTCHEAFGADPADILMAALLSSFGSIFSDRDSLPAVYNEGHGREPWDSIIDLSETVGWFTSMCPVYLPNEAIEDSNLINAVRWIKDFRRRVPDKGRPYFAYRYLTAEGKARYSTHWPMEITFNYLGQIQQLERDDSLLIPLDALSGDSINALSDVAPSTPRFSLFEVSAFVTSGSFKISVSYNRHMDRQPEIGRWIAEFETTLRLTVSQLTQLKQEPSFSDFPLLPLTYDGLSKLVDKLPELGVTSMEDLEDVYPCSPMQQGLLLSQLKDPENYTYHAIFEVTSRETARSVDMLRLSKAWQAVIGRHPSLRTIFIDSISQPGSTDQVVLRNFTARICWLETNDSEAIGTLKRQQPIDYGQLLPPHCLSICKTSTGRIFCKLEMSHAISDGTSMPIILGDLSKAYELAALERGPLYSDYVAHIQWKTTVADVDYWKSYLADVEPCHFPVLTDGEQNARELKSLDLEVPLTADLQSFCTRNGVTLSSALQLTWALVLKCYTGSDDICFGYLSSGRDVPVPGIQFAVGTFINMLTCRVNLTAGKPISDALQGVQSDFANAMEHQACSLAEIQHELKSSGTALFNTAFTFQRRSGAKDTADNALHFDFAEACDPSEYHLTINIETYDSTMVLGLTYWSDGFSESQIQGVASVFQCVLRSMAWETGADPTIGGLDFFSDLSLQQVLKWNSSLPCSVERCIHDFVEEHARTRASTTPAINGWDGDLTYAELDSITDRLASYLVSLGVGIESRVPLCFEKSTYTIIAMLAVMKAGAAFVPIDSSQPASRLKYLFESTQATLVLCSPDRSKKVSAIADNTFVVSQDTLSSLPSGVSYSNISKPKPSNAAYVIFTSGTTGLPKGTIVEHAAFCTGAIEHAKAMGMRSSSRVLQFASYTFDASVMEILSTLIVGGCVCVPSDKERMNDIPGVINRMGITWTLLTPSVASILRPDSVPSLKVLVTGGEAMSAGHINKWRGRQIALINAYGPSECSVIATIGVKVDEDGYEINRDPANIGHAIGGRNWVVNPRDHNQLVPTGGVGELVVEGRTAARGYLNNEEKTKAAFITDPDWTEKDALKPLFTRRERMYKTGDLVRRNSDGSFTYLTRKDTQIKLNGQRIEVGEIEYHVKQNLPEESQSAVDLVSPAGGRKALAVFFSLPASSQKQTAEESMSAVDEILLPMYGNVNLAAKNLEIALGNALPAYMVPSVFVPITKMPWTSSGKLDRSRLRNIAQTLSKEDVIAYKLGGSNAKRATNTEMEKKVQSLWETVLGLPSGSVGAEDNFFRIGGDSLSAMKLVGVAHSEKISMTVLNIFRTPKLSDLAKTCTILKKGNKAILQKLALLEDVGSVDQILGEVASQCRVDLASIQDAYPCSSLQEGLLTLSMKQTGAYVAKNVFRLPKNADIDRLQAAWQQTVKEVDILRTRIVHTKSSNFVQVVLEEDPISWTMTQNLQKAEANATNIPAFNGGKLAEYAIVDEGKSNIRYFVWSIHHALYDGWSMPMILGRFESNYRATESRITQIPYSHFIEYLCKSDSSSSDNFWRSKLSETSALRFPSYTPASSQETFQHRKSTHTTRISRELAKTGVTLPTIIRAAWALVIATYTSSNDVVFGETLAGRDIPVPGIENALGPTLTTIPQRIQIKGDSTVMQFLQTIHQLSAEVIPYQHAGLQRIRPLSSDTAAACDFQNLLVIQTAEENGHVSLLQPTDSGVSDSFFTYPLVVECTANVAQVEIEVHHDSNSMSDWQVQRMLYQFDSVLKQLSVAHSNPQQKVEAVDAFSPQDLQVVREWNYNKPIAVDDCIHELFKELTSRQPESPAICSWDKTFTYRELRDSALKLAGALQRLRLGPESLVPVVLDKSCWSIVSMLGILLAGAAFVPLDPAHPISRHSEIIQDVQAKVLVSPPQYAARYVPFVSHLITVDEDSMQGLPNTQSLDSLPIIKSTNTAYVIFTSGSTGKPKGVVVEHGAFCSSSGAFRQTMLMKPTSRVLQFASMTFDAGVMEVWTTLTYGGCVCIPSDDARVKDLEGTIRDMAVTWSFLTPSVANILDPSLVPCLEVLSCGGEALSEETVTKWADNVALVNGYGPTEASVFAVVNPRVSKDRDATTIGRGHDGGYTWIVASDNHDRLAPVGSVGELCLEGPLLAREYIHNEEKTSAAFVQNPAWMKAFDNGDSNRRMYKTGDLVRYNSDGSIVFIGRKDNQVKLHGQRMELGEIEHRLEVYPQIKHAFISLPKSGLCRKRLVAVVSVNDLPGAPDVLAANSCKVIPSSQRLDAARLKVAEASNRLADQVPGYMVPSIWVIMEALPILVSGKLDRKQVGAWLEQIDEPTYKAIMSGTETNESAAPQTATARLLREVWASVFDIPIESIKFSDAFLSLGGDSISAMRVMAKCRKEGFNVSLQDVLKCKSLSHLASIVGDLIPSSSTEAAEAEVIDQPFALSPIQSLFFSLIGGSKGDAQFNQSYLLEVKNFVLIEDVRNALEAIINKHSMLRARFTNDSGKGWQQRITRDLNSSYRFSAHDISDKRLMVPAIAKSQAGMDIENGPLVAANLFNIQGSKQGVFLTIHHLVVDAVSWLIILQDLQEFLNKGSLSPDNALSFQVWSKMQTRNAQANSESSTEKLLPVKFASAQMNYWGISPQKDVYGDAETLSFCLDEDVTALALGDCHKSLHTEPVDVFLSAIAQSFSRIFTDRLTASIFNESHGREPWDTSIDLSSTVGWFTLMYPLHVPVNYDDDSVDIVKQMKDARRKVPSNGRPYFASRFLTSEGRDKYRNHSPMEILFNYLGRMGSVGSDDSLLQKMDSPDDEEASRLTADVSPSTPRLAVFEISAAVSEGKLHFTFMYNKALNNIESARLWVRECQLTLQETVQKLAQIPAQPTLSDFPLLPISYSELDRLTDKSLVKAGVTRLEEIEDIYPCSPTQEGILLSQSRDPTSYIFHSVSEVVPLWLDSTLDAQKLITAWQMVVDRHPALRTVFVDSVYKGGMFDQVVVRSADSGALLIECDESEALDKLGAIKIQDHNYKKQPKLPHQLTVCRSSSGKVFFKLEINHAVIDGASSANIMRDLAFAYEGKLPSGLGPLYRDYISYIKEQSPSAGMQYWKGYLEAVQPTFFPRLNNKSTSRRLASAHLEFKKYAELQQLSKELNVTLSNVMHAAWAMVLRSYTNQDDVSFGYLTSGRDAPVKGIQDAVGAFINMLICRIQFKSQMSMKEIFRRVQTEYLDSLPHQHCSLAKVQHELKIAGKSLFNTAVSIQGSSAAEAVEGNTVSFETLVAHDPSEYAVTVNINVTPGEEGVLFRYWTDVLTEAQAVGLAKSMSELLESIIEKPSLRIEDIDEKKPQVRKPAPTPLSAPIGDIRPLIKDCVQEVIEQMFKSGALIQYNPNTSGSLPTIQVNDEKKKRNTGVQIKEVENEKVLKTIAAEITASRPTKEILKANEIVQKVRELKPITSATQTERKLRSLWSETLDVTQESIDHSDSFFELGGDSITAMEMVGAAREAGLSMTVADVFQNPTFTEMANTVRSADALEAPTSSAVSTNASREVITYAVNNEIYEPFSLLETDNIATFLQNQICSRIGVFKGGIADVMPLTDFQSLSITASLLESRWMLNYFYLDGRGDIDIKKFRQSVSKLTQTYDILRTVFVPCNDRFLQVVLRQMEPHFSVVEVDTSLESFTSQLHEDDIENPPRLGESSLRFIIAKLKGTDRHRILIRINHAQYDGIGLAKILTALQAGYGGLPLPAAPSFSRLVNHAIGRNTSTHYDYWKGLLHGSLMTQVVHRQKPNYNRAGGETITLKQDVHLPSLAAHNITDATVIKAAWALVIAELTAQSDVTFGNLVNGRTAPISGVEQIVGPCLNIIPVRVLFQPYWTVIDLLRSVQDQHVAAMPYENLGFREIIKHCTEWPNWTNFTTCVQHQNMAQHTELKLGSNKYTVGNLGSNEDFADFSVVSTPKDSNIVEIALIYASDGQIPSDFAEKAHRMLCETVANFSENPHWTLLNPKKLTGMPNQTLEEARISEDSSVLHATDGLSEAQLQILFDIVGPSWHAVLPRKEDGQKPVFNVDSDYFAMGGDVAGLALISVNLQSQGFAVSIEDLIDNPTMRDQMGLVSLQHFDNVDRDRGDAASIAGSDTSTLADADEFPQQRRTGSGRLGGSRPSMDNMWKRSMSFMGKLVKRKSSTMLPTATTNESLRAR